LDDQPTTAKHRRLLHYTVWMTNQLQQNIADYYITQFGWPTNYSKTSQIITLHSLDDQPTTAKHALHTELLLTVSWSPLILTDEKPYELYKKKVSVLYIDIQTFLFDRSWTESASE